MKTLEMSFPQEITMEHLKFCNKVETGFKEIKNNSPYSIGDVVTTENIHNFNVIGVVCGFIYCPITEMQRIVLAVNFDVAIDNLQLSNEEEIKTFDLFNKDFRPVQKRMSLLM